VYFSVLIKNLKQQLMYRTEFFLKIGGNILFIYIQICIWQSLLGAGSGMAEQVSARYMSAYVIIANVVSQLSRTAFTRIFAEKVAKGDIAVDFVRPINLKFYWFAEQLSEHICTAFFTCVPVLITAALLWGLIVPVSLIQVFQFILSLVFAVILAYHIDYIAGLCVFWTRSDVYTRQIVSGLKTIFSGSVIPIWFFPGWLYNISRFLPFRMLVYEPVQIYLGRLDAADAWRVILLQLLWILVLYAIERWVWSILKKEVVINGG